MGTSALSTTGGSAPGAAPSMAILHLDAIQRQFETRKAAAFRAHPTCASCEQPIAAADQAIFFEDINRLAHHGACATAAFKGLWHRIAGRGGRWARRN